MSQGGRPTGPGPGSAIQNAIEYRRDPLGFLTRCVRAYGDLVALRLADVPAYILSHPDFIEHVLVRRGGNYVRDRFIQQGRKHLGAALLADTDDARGQLQRRRLQPLLSHGHAIGYAQSLIMCSESYASRWPHGRVQDIYEEMRSLTLDVMLRVIFGAAAGPGLTEIRNHAEAAMRHMRAAMELPFRSATATPAAWGRETSLFTAELDALRALVDTQIDYRRRCAQGGEGMLAALLGEPAGPSGQMDASRLRDEMVSLLVASHETTALALSYTWYLLASHPTARAALESELSNVLGGRPPAPGDIERLAYTHQLVREALRLYPPVWILTREAVCADVIADCAIEAGSLILMPRWIVQRDPRFFDAPDEFRPERWATGAARHRLAYFPFGAGARRCIGSAFAMVELVLIVATIAQQVRFAVPADYRLELLPTLHLRPRDGLRLEVVSRAGGS
jgi:cytochrome P450